MLGIVHASELMYAHVSSIPPVACALHERVLPTQTIQTHDTYLFAELIFAPIRYMAILTLAN